MICSMTAFSRIDSNLAWGSLTWELRSVNHRYLEPSFKLPENLRQLETALRDMLRKNLARGKIDCSLKLSLGTTENPNIVVNIKQAKAVIAATEAIKQLEPSITSNNALDILRWPGVVDETSVSRDSLLHDALASFDAALAELIESRQREGTQLQQFIMLRLDKMDTLVSEVKQLAPEILTLQRQKLTAKVSELVAELDQSRLEQELVLMAQKADVDEEMDRLGAHLSEVRRVVTKGGACGRRLDFLMQELNREANTLSSKSISQSTTQAAVEMKVLIEQMREQVQNIE
ncbi:MAG: hypothetical protein ACI90U_001482 [Pseudomonadales bacterium]|jgi:uncharacterized protein (TIGR00255 family)